MEADAGTKVYKVRQELIDKFETDNRDLHREFDKFKDKVMDKFEIINSVLSGITSTMSTLKHLSYVLVPSLLCNIGIIVIQVMKD